ncbi:polysaccharide pyruvyl transferase family protein [Leptothoe sp. PORK10 BA2]|uniref:polysaccharide pyruvyl transferase family protein n=1 Tax=Leptothoe sp. PORK10 BA2 TaxID=3110254 RepID=UPI002B205713|nr:polysaccharide pyruvyl transferase family protein [Leptothoe sp. PORK10 BA2]MEA5466102.1 polysaccharide pyruvyl transferase family protein [Leptothoe sp. PORK10 BA2]
MNTIKALVNETKFIALRLQKKTIRKRIPNSAFILPPASPGSLGDEALVVGAIEYLAQSGITTIGIMSHDPKRQWKIDKPIESTDIKHHYLYGSLSSEKSPYNFLKAVSDYEKFYCIGADVMDGYYSERDTVQRLKFTSIAHSIGIESSIVSFSFNQQPPVGCVEAFQRLSPNIRLCVRDPISLKRLEKITNNPINQVADLAFLLTPKNNTKVSEMVDKWVFEQHTKNNIVLGVNANYKLIENLENQSLQTLSNIYIDTLIRLYDDNNALSFVLIPHDFRNIGGTNSDVALAEAIYQGLPTTLQSQCFNVPAPFSAGEVKGIVGKLDFVLSGRMHLAIACLGQGTPAACITYQGKFEGLFRHFDIKGMEIEPKEALEPQQLVSFLSPLIEKRNEISQHIRQKLPQVKEKSTRNFSS